MGDEEERKRAEEEAARKAEEEEAARKVEEEEAARKAEEEEAARKRKEEEEAAERKRKEDGEMIPASRLRGLLKEKADAEERAKKAERELALKKREGMSELERQKYESEEMKARIDEFEKRETELQTKLKRAALRDYLVDALSPLAIGLVPSDIVELGEDDLLTASSKAAIDAWKKGPDVKPFFSPARRGGDAPRPGTGAPMTKDAYEAIVHDPAKTAQEKQTAHERYLATLESQRR